MEDKFIIGVLELCVECGYIPKFVLRNVEIIADYKELSKDKSKKIKDIKIELSNKYCTSIKNIETIIYGKKKNEKPN